jgi:tetratricopeptide (TPR) repeat protein
VRLREYFNLGAESRGDWQKAYEYKKTVAERYAQLLDDRSPVTLRARTSMLQEYFWQTRFDEAEIELLEVSRAQHDVLAESVDYFSTLQLLGLAQFYINKFDESCRTLEESQNGLQNCLGSADPNVLMAELYKGYTHEAKGKLDQAFALYEDIYNHWAPVMGIEHPLSLMVQCAFGSIHRKRKEFDQAEMIILQSYNTRLRFFTIGNNVCVDSAIQLASVYRDKGCGKQAIELLDSISSSSVFRSDFERVCQVQHIRALVDFDAGEYRTPKLLLQRLLHQASGKDRDKNNRELLWIRITLADVLRHHGDNDEASMLFSDLVEPDGGYDSGDESNDPITPPSPSSLDGEPEPPIQLTVAEKALRFLKDADQEKARNLLKEHQLRWVRKRDFWIMQGGPITDTASMVPVRLRDDSD